MQTKNYDYPKEVVLPEVRLSNGLVFPIRFKDLPPIIREIVENAPDNRKLPSLIACLAPLCAIATRVRLKYAYDNRLSALLIQVIIEGAQSVGKSFAADIERLLMDGTLKLRDQEQRLAEQIYREKKKRRSQNKELEEEPKTTICVIPATISKTVLTKRADLFMRVYGAVLTFWMFAEELAQVTDACKQGYSNLRTIMRTAYDYGSQFGIDYASDNSYSAIVDINICSMFCATPSAVDEYMDKKAIEGGNISRQILCQIGDDIGSDGAIFKPLSEEQLATINQMLDLMMKNTFDSDGKLCPEIQLDTRWIDSTVKHWCRKKGTEALLTGHEAIDVFRKRSSVSAFRCAALLYYIYLLDAGFDCHKEIPTDDKRVKMAIRLCKKFYVFMADYILQSMLSRWGARFEEYNSSREDGSARLQGPTLYDELSFEFTRDQLNALLKQRQRTTPSRVLICQWQNRKLIKVIGENRYQKILKQDPFKPTN